MNGDTRRGTKPMPGSLRPLARLIPLLLAVSGWGVLGIVAAQTPSAIRIIAVFAFTLVCPGTAVIRILPLQDLLERTVLAVAIGLSLAVLIGEAVALGRPASARFVVVALALVCTTAALVEMAKGARSR